MEVAMLPYGALGDRGIGPRYNAGDPGSAKKFYENKVKGLCAPWMVWRTPWMADCGQAGYSLFSGGWYETNRCSECGAWCRSGVPRVCSAARRWRRTTSATDY